MKINTLIAAASLLALLSCNKEGAGDMSVTDGYFSEGQTVQITVDAESDAQSDTRVNGTLGSGGDLTFKWETGDKILVKNGSKSAVFTLKSGEGTQTAIFQGTLPSGVTTFDVQYPVSGVAASKLTNQTYKANDVPDSLLLATKTGCTLGSNVVLQPQYAVLRLNFWGSAKVGKIVVTSSATPSTTYTLNCPSGGVTIGTTAANATPFFMVVPQGTSNWNFTAEVFSDDKTTSLGTFVKTSTAPYAAKGKVLNMPAQEVSVPHLFTVDNKGKGKVKTVQFTKGNLYWDGSDWKIEKNQCDFPNVWDDHHVGHFYWSDVESYLYEENYPAPTHLPGDVFAFAEGNNITVDGQTDLYVLSDDEFRYLVTGRTNAGSLYKAGVTVGVLQGCLVLAPDDFTGTIRSSYDVNQWPAEEAKGLVCLPPVGYRCDNAFCYGSIHGSCYCTSTLVNGSENQYCLFSFDSTDIKTKTVGALAHDRGQASAIRLVF